jgi:polyhydroxyalkanoate synthesis regulator phasin
MDQIIADLNNASNKIKNEYMIRQQQLKELYDELKIANQESIEDINKKIRKLEQQKEDIKDLYKTIRETIDTKILLMNID